MENENKNEQELIKEETPQVQSTEPQREVDPDAYVSLININKVYDNGFHAVHDFNIDIKKKEFIVFVGPSGCGKSTSLRMIAGLEDISTGDLIIDGQRVNDLSPRDRNIAMVFQSYALYPHMTVFDNMAYSLKIRKFPVVGLTPFEKEKFEKEIEKLTAKANNPETKPEAKQKALNKIEEIKQTIESSKDLHRMLKLNRKEIHEKVLNAAKILQIENLLDRKPKQLSGGQRQRVALGRAIVRNAKVFLMDEPLSNLDAKLRVQMRSEIVKLHNQIGATTIYVTHDQTEAMTMASRIVIMKDGFIQQIGTPIEIFNRPNNLFVASFIGSPAMNFFNVEYKKDSIVFENGASIKFPKEFVKNRKLKEKMVLGIRPEHIYDCESNVDEKYKKSPIDIKVELTELLGSEYYVHNDFNGIKFISKQEAITELKVNDTRKCVLT